MLTDARPGLLSLRSVDSVSVACCLIIVLPPGMCLLYGKRSSGGIDTQPAVCTNLTQIDDEATAELGEVSASGKKFALIPLIRRGDAWTRAGD